MKYIVTYDLNRAGQNYDGLINAIKQYPCVHPMQSVWFIESRQDSRSIYNHLKQHIDNNDYLFVSEITTNHIGWLPTDACDFIGN